MFCSILFRIPILAPIRQDGIRSMLLCIVPSFDIAICHIMFFCCSVTICALAVMGKCENRKICSVLLCSVVSDTVLNCIVLSSSRTHPPGRWCCVISTRNLIYRIEDHFKVAGESLVLLLECSKLCQRRRKKSRIRILVSNDSLYCGVFLRSLIR